jgi:hypothetical protein
LIKVFLFNTPKIEMDLHGYHIESFDPMCYFDNLSHFSTRDFISNGMDGYSKHRALIRAEGIDRLYRDRDPCYMRMVKDFLDRFQDFDLVVMGNYNFIHPEILFHELKKPIKVLGFIDDPYSTYIRGVPYLWAFDGAFYISPAYNEKAFFHEKLSEWGVVNSYWWPLVQPSNLPERTEEFFQNRVQNITYVGNPTMTKVDRLIDLKNHFDSQFRVHGKWRARGYYGLLRGLLGMPIYWGKVDPISNKARESLYFDTKIGFNMHVSDRPTETGNMRMYETPAHGMLQICDKAAKNAHELIFIPDKEAIFYDDIPDAIDKIEYYLDHDNERIEIARAGYERVRQDYQWEDSILKFLDWAVSLPKKNGKNV